MKISRSWSARAAVLGVVLGAAGGAARWAAAVAPAGPAAPVATGQRGEPTSAHGAAYWGAWPVNADPVVTGTKVAENLLTRGMQWERVGISYHESVTAYGCLRFAAGLGDRALLDKLVQRYDVILTERGKRLITRPSHVDETVFGIVPLEIFVLTGSDAEKKVALADVAKLPPVTPIKADGGPGTGPGGPGRGPTANAQREAEAQWAALKMPHQEQVSKWLTIGKSHADTQWASPTAEGLTDQTRYWVDDMFMITSLQCLAYRATGEKIYLDRAANEMVSYLDKLQQPNGLFFHADTAHFFWSRGNGWYAVGMAELLSDLPADHPQRARILEGYKKMMAGLLKYQAEDGMWRQLIDVPQAWEESSGTGMFTFGLAMGVRHGWLPEADYKAAAKKGWEALAKHLNAEGLVTDVCVGTGAGPSQQFYLARQRLVGDFHGQAAFSWAAWAMMQ